MANKKLSQATSEPTQLLKSDLLDSTLTKDGAEISNPVSLSVTAYLPTMGERIRRYMRTPGLAQDIYNNPDLWDPEDAEVVFRDDGSPISRHETRYKEGLKKAQERHVKIKAEEKEAAKAKHQEEQAAFRKRVKEAMADGENTP